MIDPAGRFSLASVSAANFIRIKRGVFAIASTSCRPRCQNTILAI